MAEGHPLQHTWCIWEQRSADKRNMTDQEWKDLQKKLCEFSTVEDFWRYFYHLPPPSDVFYDGRNKKRVGSPPNDRTIESFSLFKKNVAPEWEDPANKTGGEWVMRKSFRAEEIDEYWRNIVYGIVGETIEDPAVGDMITGARVVDKSNGKGHQPTYRLELWLRTKDAKLSEGLKRRLLDIMGDGTTPRGLTDGFQWKSH